MSDLIFVYGSLRSDSCHPMHRELSQRSSFVARARVRGDLYLAEFPGAIFSESAKGWILGEVHRFTDEADFFAVLDAWEACAPTDPEPHEYRRIVVDAVGEGQPMRVWAYEYAFSTKDLPLIESGDWVAHRRSLG